MNRQSRSRLHISQEVDARDTRREDLLPGLCAKAVIARSVSDEAIQCSMRGPGLLRFARNDEDGQPSPPCKPHFAGGRDATYASIYSGDVAFTISSRLSSCAIAVKTVRKAQSRRP